MHMKRLLLWLATVLAVLYASLAISYRFLRPDPEAAAAESYMVYSAYLSGGGLGATPALDDASAPLVILDHTTCPLRVCLPPAMPDAAGFLRAQLAIENLNTTPLARRFDRSLHYALAPSTSTAIFQQPEFSRSYGQITFSAVSFDHRLERALFYTERLCGLCGGAHFVLMHKVGGTWTVEREVANGVS